jgi:hypothetical protein
MADDTMTTTYETLTDAAEAVAAALREAGYTQVRVWDRRGTRVYFAETLSRRTKDCGYVEVLDVRTFAQSGITSARARVREIVATSTGLVCSCVLVSAEIVIGACYRDKRDGEVVRVTSPVANGWYECTVVVPVPSVVGDPRGTRVERDVGTYAWTRIPDPTPAIADDDDVPEPITPATVAKLATWLERHDLEMTAGRTRGGMWYASVERADGRRHSAIGADLAACLADLAEVVR